MIKIIRKKQGFTLIEIVLVVTIIGLLTALISPELGRTVTRFELVTSARELGGYIRYVQQRAINGESTNITLLFNPVNNSYSLKKMTVVEKTINLPEGVSFFALPRQGYAVCFTIDGNPSNCSGTIVIQSRYSEKYYVKVLPATGKVVISTTK